MGNIKVKRKADCIVVTQTRKKTEPLNHMEIDIINHREIPSLPPIEILHGLGGTKLRFRLNNAIPLLSYLQQDISFSEFLRLVQQIIGVFQSCQAHGVRMEDLDLQVNHLFYDCSSRTVQLLYWPLLSVEEGTAIETLFHWMGDVYSHSRPASEFIDEYMEYFDRRGAFDLFHFERAIRSLQHDWTEEQKRRNRGSAPQAGGSPVPMLRRLSTNARIELNAFPFVLGRSPGDCNYVIADNPHVGRRHLALNCRGGRIYAVDLHSTNGSLLDGGALSPGREVPLPPVCKLTLGDEEFMFFAQGEP